MAEEGFRYFPAPEVEAPEASRPQWLITPDIAVAQGFGGREAAIARALKDSAGESAYQSRDQLEYFTTLGESGVGEYNLALMGPEDDRVLVRTPYGSVSKPGSGCLVEGERSLPGYGEAAAGLLAAFYNVQDLLGESMGRRDSDPDFQAAEEMWRLCLANEGYDVESPARLWNYLVGEVWQVDLATGASALSTRAATQAEMAFASSHASCLVQSRFADVWIETTNDYESIVLAENEAIVVEWLEADAILNAAAGGKVVEDIQPIPSGVRSLVDE